MSPKATEPATGAAFPAGSRREMALLGINPGVKYGNRIIANNIKVFWRRGWDSNPRYGFPYTRFPSERLKPLGHLSIPTKKFTGNIATEFRGTKSADLSADRGRNHPAQISSSCQTKEM
jgi:hypothetical protein